MTIHEFPSIKKPNPQKEIMKYRAIKLYKACESIKEILDAFYAEGNFSVSTPMNESMITLGRITEHIYSQYEKL